MKMSNAVRCLFGAADKSETEVWLRKKLNEISQESRQRWSFDFDCDVPCASSASTASTTDRSNVNVSDDSYTPSFYRSRDISHQKRRQKRVTSSAPPAFQLFGATDSTLAPGNTLALAPKKSSQSAPCFDKVTPDTNGAARQSVKLVPGARRQLNDPNSRIADEPTSDVQTQALNWELNQLTFGVDVN